MAGREPVLAVRRTGWTLCCWGGRFCVDVVGGDVAWFVLVLCHATAWAAVLFPVLLWYRTAACRLCAAGHAGGLFRRLPHSAHLHDCTRTRAMIWQGTYSNQPFGTCRPGHPELSLSQAHTAVWM